MNDQNASTFVGGLIFALLGGWIMLSVYPQRREAPQARALPATRPPGVTLH